ncbi:glycosyl hydrolase family 20, catalytic domain protein [Sphingobacterium spiritivorum ATCC 33300]|uniref:beta-N-acetylhexosaminidase n=1 Tax=Sphingobacterium spiritivorum ATCC 33300 TaxID=525372 RepID=C2G4M8_SPHSI|nr:beta-N-acetylhexosaminidase [Sphingobacterium spiritivorum]EEI89841.1 glycosyl hydrolase family 20, catalytic domain protein [Sphingobacterium spiritivorum ATCC 33300]QQS94828.1 beta-N-acetylhexosaminidase [Sphingobacterium spiritivorum]
MNKVCKVICLICILHFSFSLKAKAIDVIPRPASVSERQGEYLIKNNIGIYSNDNLNNEIAFIVEILKDEQGLKSSKVTSSKQAGIRLLIRKTLQQELGTEGYRLEADGEGILIEAPTSTGVFYGIQTLRQLIKKGTGFATLACISISDSPRFSWRSYMLDEGRAYKGKAVVKRLLEEMATLKMNVFHWHLTEDQGWRLAIEKYPNLTKIGGRRDSTQIGGWNSKLYDGKPIEGYYTRADIKEIVAYAKALHINIVPEIEMPGHASAAIASYPWLGVTKLPISVPTSFGVKYDVFDVTDPKVTGFLQDVLSEVITMFPSDVIHIGGDEVKYDQWNNSPEVQAYMKKHTLASPADLQISFTNGISNFLEKNNKRMMGWNDIMGAKLHDYNQDAAPVTGTLSKSAIIQFWKGNVDLMKEAARNGYDIVNSYHEATYLDYSNISLEKAYSFNPVPDGLDKQYHSKILGLGCQMWGEWISEVKDMYRQTFPRIAAYAEVGWTKVENKNYAKFEQALPYFYNRWSKKEIDFNK